MKHILPILALLFFQFSAIAQFGPEWDIFYTDSTNLPPPADINQFTVTDMAVDNDGLLWGTTTSGVFNYDGSLPFTVFDESNGMLEQFANTIAFTSTGTMYVGTDSGLLRYDGTTWELFNEANSDLYDDKIEKIVIDSDDNLYIAGGLGGMRFFDGTVFDTIWTGNSSIPSDFIDDLALDNLGNLWMASWTGGLYKLNLVTMNFTFYDTTNSDILPHVDVVTVDKSGEVWLGAYDGLQHFDPSTETFTTFTESSNGNHDILVIRDVYQDSDDNIWIGMGNGFGIMKYNGALIEKVDGWVNVYTIEEDASGNIWFGAYEALYKYDPDYVAPAAVKEIKDNFFMEVFPNPSRGQITLNIPQNFEEKQISIYNQLGKVVARDAYVNGTNWSFDGNHLPAGMYFLEIQTGSVQQTKPFVIY